MKTVACRWKCEKSYYTMILVLLQGFSDPTLPICKSSSCFGSPRFVFRICYYTESLFNFSVSSSLMSSHTRRKRKMRLMFFTSGLLSMTRNHFPSLSWNDILFIYKPSKSMSEQLLLLLLLS